MRLPRATREGFPEEIRYVWDRAGGGAAEGDTLNIVAMMANNPRVFHNYMRLGNALWSECGLDPATRELVILRTALLHRSVYEWHQHVRIGREAGLDDERILALRHWEESDRFSEAERALLAYVDATVQSDHPRDDIHEGLAAHYPPGTIVGVNLLAGFYGMTAHFLAAMEVEPETTFVGWDLAGGR